MNKAATSEPQNLWRKLDQFIRVIGSADFSQMGDALQEVLLGVDTRGRKPGLLILDEQGAVQLFIASPGRPLNSDEMEQIANWLLGGLPSKSATSLKAVFDVLLRVALEAGGSQALLLKRSLPLGLDSNERAQAPEHTYDGFSLRENEAGELVLRKEPLFTNMELDQRLLFSLGASRPADHHVVFVNRWPGTPGFQPSFVVAGYTPQQKFDSSSDLLADIGLALDNLAWPMQMAAFVFQLYVQNNASSTTARPIAEEMLLSQLTQLLNVAGTSADIERRIDLVLKAPTPLGTRVLDAWGDSDNPDHLLLALSRIFAALAPSGPRIAPLMHALLTKLDGESSAQWCETALAALTMQLIRSGKEQQEELFLRALEVADEFLGFLPKNHKHRIFNACAEAARHLSSVSLIGRSVATLSLAYSLLDSEYSELSQTAKKFAALLARCDWRHLPAPAFSLLSERQRELIRFELRRSQAAPVLLEAVERLLKRSPPSKQRYGSNRSRAVSVLSFKGGVGKTLVALGTASLLSKEGSVCLIDLDLAGPTLSQAVAVSGDHTSFNELLFASMWRSLDDNYSQAFKRKRPEMLESLPRELDESLLDRSLASIESAPLSLKGVDIISSSSSAELQDLAVSILSSGTNLRPFKRALRSIAGALWRRYDFLVFDTPAELKDVSLVSSFVTAENDGRNLFVGTLYKPSLNPMPELIGTYLHASKNSIVLNKVRQFDRHLASDAASLADYLAASGERSFAQHGWSPRFLEAILALPDKPVSQIPWSASLERFLQREDPSTSLDDCVTEVSSHLHAAVLDSQ